MPKALVAEMKKGYKGKGLSEDEVDRRVYGGLNNMGAMRGSKMTKKGARMERKFRKDRGMKMSSEDAAEALRSRR